MTRVVALDVAYGDAKKRSGTGVAMEGEVFTVSAPAGTTGPARLVKMRAALLAAIHGPAIVDSAGCPCFSVPYGIHPDLVAIEGYSYSSPHVAHQLGELGGVLRVELFELMVPFIVVAPATAKRYACGNGSASKDQMLLAAVRRLGYEGESKDQADALWVRAAVLAALGEPVVDVPKAHETALIPLRKELTALGLSAGLAPVATLQ